MDSSGSGKIIVQQLEQIWAEARAWPGYLQAMHALLSAYSPQSQAGSQLLAKWASLPGLCCQAAGGQAEWADELAAAWMVFYGAANIMDTVEDGDPPDPEWADLSPGTIVNAASGMYFSASAILNNMKKRPPVREVADEVIAEFYKGFLTMCGGQHRDLVTARPGIDQYWEIAASKSSAFFALACRLGAALATRDPGRLAGFHEYGVQLGLMLQIMDDIEDIQKAACSENWDKLYKTLPVIYALQDGQPKARARLETLLQAGGTSQEAGEELMDLIDDSGAVRFLIDEFASLRKEAVCALSQARPVPQYEEKLIAFLPKIY